MDQGTQQNVAMAGQMSAAGAALAMESVKLAELLSHFRFGQQVSAPGQTTARRSAAE
jgi:hypothetical protein